MRRSDILASTEVLDPTRLTAVPYVALSGDPTPPLIQDVAVHPADFQSHRILAHTVQAGALLDAQQDQDQGQMELIMSTISQAVVSLQVGTVLQRSGQVLKSWWVAYITWRRERFAMRQLRAMSDRELRDIGIGRTAIEFVVKSGQRN